MRDGYEHRGTRAVQRMVEFAPSTGGLALWVRHEDVAAEGALLAATDDGTLPVATDGKTLFYGPGFDALPLEEQTGLVAHEVLHIALRHPQRMVALRRLLGDVDPALFNACADAIVNSTLAHLRWMRLPSSSVFLEELLASALGVTQPLERALLEWDVERLYRAIDDREPQDERGRASDRAKRRGGGERSEAAGGGPAAREPEEARKGGARRDGPRATRVRALASGAMADLLPSPEAEGAPEEEAEQAREWSERVLRGHANDGAHSMLRALLADLPRSRTPWEHVLRTRLARALSPSRGVSWSRPSRSYIANQGRAGPNRRMPWEPGQSGAREVPRLVVIVDVSGSIDDALMGRFAGEIEAITRRLEAAVILVVGDDHVQRVERFEPGRADLRGVAFHGRGGTDFTPLLEEADKHAPDLVVVLTDLDGPARVRPRWPVLWAVPESHAAAEPPFGRKLVLTFA